MKVLINGQLYKSNETPILIICSENDKKTIGTMTGPKGRYYAWDDKLTIDEMKEVLQLDKFTDEELAPEAIEYKD